MLKQLHINIPFIDALEQMPTYVQFLKDILARKQKINDLETVALSQTTSDIFKEGVPAKMTDLASINLMPLSIFKKLEIGDVQPTLMRLEFANRSIANPEGKIEDVLTKVDKLLFLQTSSFWTTKLIERYHYFKAAIPCNRPCTHRCPPRGNDHAHEQRGNKI